MVHVFYGLEQGWKLPPTFFLSMVKSHPVPEKHRKKQRSPYVCDISSCVCNQEIALFVLFLLHGFKNCVVVGKMIALLFNPWSVWKRFLREAKVCIFEKNSVALCSELLDVQILFYFFFAIFALL